MKKLDPTHATRAALAATGVVLALALAPAAALASGAPLVDRPVTFDVQNLNRSIAPCGDPVAVAQVDGKRYRITGRLVGPPSALGGNAIALYLHGATSVDYFKFDAVPDHDYALKMAQLGHTSVVIDQLGYGANGPVSGLNGFATCEGGQADVAHQIVNELRAGTYKLGGGASPPPKFERVALAGQSLGGQVAETEAYSWPNAQDPTGAIDALLLIAAGTGGQTQFTGSGTMFTLHVVPNVIAACGAEKADPLGDGYVFTWPTKDLEIQDTFYRADKPVIGAFTPVKDPCGVLISQPSQADAVKTNIKVPVLLVFGDHDALCPASPSQSIPDPADPGGPSCQDAVHAVYQGRKEGDTTFVQIHDAGHELVLEQDPLDGTPNFLSTMDKWLTLHGFSSNTRPSDKKPKPRAHRRHARHRAHRRRHHHHERRRPAAHS